MMKTEPLALILPRMRVGSADTVGHPVQHDPVGSVLIEDQIGLAADVEAVPGQNGLFARLIDGDQGAAISADGLFGTIGADPETGVQSDTLGDLKTALAKTIGYSALGGEGGGAGRRLRIRHGLSRRGGGA